MVTFHLYRLSQCLSIHHQGRNYFITLEIHQTACKEGKKDEKEVELTAISISSVLSFAWMAVNPPNSPNWTKKTEEMG